MKFGRGATASKYNLQVLTNRSSFLSWRAIPIRLVSTVTFIPFVHRKRADGAQSGRETHMVREPNKET